MKITLKRTPEQVELIKAMASKNRSVAVEAQVALAEFIGPVLAEIINNAPTLSNLFTSLQFNADDNPSIPLDLYYDITAEDYITVYSQSVAGGLPQNQEKTSANLVLSALAAATTNGKAHVQRANTNGRFLLADLNELFTLAKRINTSWAKGTPDARQSRGITDLIVSPEVVQELRAMAYNPINTKGSLTDIPATDEIRTAVYNSAGIPEFYGVSIMEINELGVGQRFNTIFDTVAGTTNFKTADGTTATGVFGTSDEIIIGLDRSRESLIRAVAVDSENSSEFTLTADDQYSIRQNKIGYFGSLEEGRMVLDNRALVGKIVSGLA